MGRTVVFGDCICQAVIDGPWAACTEGQVSGRMRLADPFFQGESICDNDNVCENPPETCSNCPNDCHCDPVPEFSVVGVGIATFLIGLIGGMFMQKKKK